MQNQSAQIQFIYYRIVDNAKLFLKKGIAEILMDGHQPMTVQQAVLSCLYIQMATELAIKAFLIENEDIRIILTNQFQDSTNEELEIIFKENGLHTKTFNQLKKYIINKYTPLFFDSTDIQHFDRFQDYRNKLVHFNLFFSIHELERLKFELIYIIAQVIVKLLSHLNLAYDSPNQFYKENLEELMYDELLNYSPYRTEMSRIAKSYTGYAYECIECLQRSFSPQNDRCYYCEADLSHITEYLDCNACDAKKAIVFDPLNISENGNHINGVCLNCGDKPMVFKCPKCSHKTAYYVKQELVGTCYERCLNA